MPRPLSPVNKWKAKIKWHSLKYAGNHNEPKDNPLHDIAAHDETVLVENSVDMKRRLRLVAQKIRVNRLYDFKTHSRKNTPR
jgi:hypothetical protein